MRPATGGSPGIDSRGRGFGADREAAAPARQLLEPDPFERRLKGQVLAEGNEMDLVVDRLEVSLIGEDHEAVVALGGCRRAASVTAASAATRPR